MEDLYLAKMSDFRRMKTLGSGNFGKAVLALSTEHRNLVVFKFAKSDRDFNDSRVQSDFVKENHMMNSLRYPSIVCYHGFSWFDFKGRLRPSIIISYKVRGSLDKMIFKCHGFLTTSMKKVILLGISYGMRYLHSRGITHRDLKPANILLDKHLHPFISDFNTSIYATKAREETKETDDSVEEFNGTVRFMSPEQMSQKKQSNKTDVYSFGILMFCLLTEEDPFPEIEDENLLIYLVCDEGERPIIKGEHGIKEEYVDLMKSCWEEDPSLRPSFDEIITSLESIDGFDDEEVCEYKEVLSGEYSERIFSEGMSLYANNKHDEAIQFFKMSGEYGNWKSTAFVANCILESQKNKNAKDYDLAYRKYRDSADHDIGEGFYGLSVCYKNGFHVGVDYNEAFHNAQIAASLGSSNGQYLLAKLYHEGIGVDKDCTKAFHYAELSANQGNSKGEGLISLFYRDGIGCEKDKIMSLEYMFKSEAKGDPFGEYLLGMHYLMSEPNKKTIILAFDQLKSSAEKGCPEAQYELGKELIQKDFKEAKKWIKMSADQNYGLANLFMSIIAQLDENEGSYEDKSHKSNVYSERSKNNKDPAILLASALHYLNGLMGYGEDSGKAWKYTLEATKLNYSYGFNLLASFYEFGYCVEKDDEKAVMYFRKSIECDDNPYACLALGKKMLVGSGTPKNIKEGIKLIERVSSTGNEDAQAILGYLMIIGNGVEKNVEKGLEILHKFEKTSIYTAAALYRYYNDERYLDDILPNIFSDISTLAKHVIRDRICDFILDLSIGIPNLMLKKAMSSMRYKGIAGLIEHHRKVFSMHYFLKCPFKNTLDAMHYFADEIGEAEDQHRLGINYHLGIFCDKRPDLAVKYYKLAAQKDYFIAYYDLGLCYMEGLGVEKNNKIARKLFVKAKEKGYPNAEWKINILDQYSKLKELWKDMHID